MKRNRQFFMRFFTSHDLPFGERIFNFVCFLGALAAMAALIAQIAEDMPVANILTMVLMFIAIIFVFFLSEKRSGSVSSVTVIAVFGLTIVFWPIVFFTNGGSTSGMAAYFSMALILHFLLLKGKTRIFGLILTSVVTILCYVSALFWDWNIIPGFIDDMQSIFVTGLFIGAVIVFQNRVYMKEKEKAETARKERTEALEEAAQAGRAKGDFLSKMLHEIRAPMNTITGMTLIGKSSQTAEKKDFAFDKIEDASNHLLGVISDILDMSKIEANKLELSLVNFEFGTMLQKVVNAINFKVNKRRQNFYVNVDSNIPRMLVGDDQRLAQVITNFMSNAVKFTPEEGTIHLDARLLKEEYGKCRLLVSVTDTGIGISDEQKTHLFRSFEQAEAGTSRKYGGAGFGLAISKSIIEMMDGEVWVESELGHGSKFSFTVVLQHSSEEVERPLLNGNIDRSAIRIFAADEDPQIRQFFADLCAKLGIFCTVASSCEEAEKLLAQDYKYSVFFIDWKLSGSFHRTKKALHHRCAVPLCMNGTELARYISTITSSVAMMFSLADWNVIENEAHSAGVDKFLQKPLFPSAIVDIINQCLGVNCAAEQEKTDKEADDFSNYTILIAEDAEVNREIMLALLEPTNLTVDCAENGTQALKMFTDSPDRYAMIFMDVQMPQMDGYETTRYIRAFEAEHCYDRDSCRHIPIVAMTANVFHEDIERCIEAGMNAHIGKPLVYDELLCKLRTYLTPESFPARDSAARKTAVISS
ncbi:MAG: response regulator [Treponema sp.]|nr:response regulator [Treponema sp.]